MMLVMALAAAMAAQASVELVEDPVVGRRVRVSNGIVAVEVAPRLGGRLLRLRRVGGERLVLYHADWTQTKEGLQAEEGSEGLSDRRATTWVTADDAPTPAVRWRQGVRVGDVPVTVTREIALPAGLPAAVLRVTVTNEGETTLHDLRYNIRLHLKRCDVLETGDGRSLDREALLSTDTRETAEGVVLHCGAETLRPDFPGAQYRIIGESYMFRLEHYLPLGAVAAGESVSATGVWWITAGDETPAEVSVDFEALRIDRRVPPLAVSAAPPDELPATPATTTGPWGVCGGTGVEDHPLWRAAGIRWARAGFGWAAGEPEQGEYDFERFDATVESAQRNGIGLIGLVMGTPSWASTDGRTISPPRDYEAFGRYVEALTRRYRGRVDVWEIWNEPDISQFFTGTTEEYATLLRTAYRAARRGNPDCLVMSAGLDGPGERFLVELAELGALEHCDIIGFHPYGGNPRIAEDRMRDVWRVLNFYEVRRPVWITEVGWQSGGWRSGPGVVDSERTKARYLRGAYERLSRYAEVICWYRGREPGDMYGLVRPTRPGLVLNEAWHALREISGADERAPLAIDGPARAEAVAGERGAARWTVRNRSERERRVRLTLHDPPAWARLEPAEMTLEASASAEVALQMAPPEYAVEREVPVVICAMSGTEPGAVAEVTIAVTNPGDSYAVRAVALWPINATPEGEEDGSWTPASRLVTAAGGHRKQPFRVYNEGSATDTYALQFGGDAAPWLVSRPDSVTVAPGEDRWVSVLIHVPEDAEQGVAELSLAVTSTTYPQVTAQAHTTVTVGEPGE